MTAMTGQEQMRQYRAKHPGFVERGKVKSRDYMRTRRERDPEFAAKQKISMATWRKKLKDEMFAAYGGAICACCGETERVFLQLDHIDGGGRHHRRSLGHNVSPNGTLRDLKKKGWPPGFQILCANCNMAKHLLGVCPHKAKQDASR